METKIKVALIISYFVIPYILTNNFMFLLYNTHKITYN